MQQTQTMRREDCCVGTRFLLMCDEFHSSRLGSSVTVVTRQRALFDVRPDTQQAHSCRQIRLLRLRACAGSHCEMFRQTTFVVIFALMFTVGNAGPIAYATCQAACAAGCAACGGATAGACFVPCYAICQQGCAAALLAPTP